MTTEQITYCPTLSVAILRQYIDYTSDPTSLIFAVRILLPVCYKVCSVSLRLMEWTIATFYNYLLVDKQSIGIRTYSRYSTPDLRAHVPSHEILQGKSSVFESFNLTFPVGIFSISNKLL